MSFIEIAEIEYNSVKTCFISIPKTWNICSTNNICIFKIKSLESEKSKEVLMSWSGDYTYCKNENIVSINGLFANKMGFNRKQQVLVTFVEKFESNSITNCDKCYLKPITENDWEILALNSTFIESNLLNQIRVLFTGQIFPIWVKDSNICVFVEAFRLRPNHSNAILLNAFTEVIVCPPVNNIDFDDNVVNNEQTINDMNGNHSKSNTSMITSMFGFVKSFLPNDNSIDENDSTIDRSVTNSNIKTNENFELELNELEFNLNDKQVLRVLPFDNENEDKDIVNTVFISSDEYINKENKYFISKLTHMLSPFEKKRENQKSDKKEEVKSESNDAKSYSKLLSEMDFKETSVLVCVHNQCPNSCIYICDNLRRHLGLSITSRVLLSDLNYSSIPLINHLILCPIGVSHKRSKITNDLIMKEFVRLIEKTPLKMLFITNGSLIHLCEIGFYSFHKNDSLLSVITQSSVKQLSIEVSEPVMCNLKPFCEIPLPLSSVKDIDKHLSNSYKTHALNKPLGGFNDIFLKCFNFINFALNLNNLSNHLNQFSAIKSCSLLIHGQKGSGKSHLINSLIKKLTNYPHFVYVQYIDCSLLKGKRIESIDKSWNNYLAEAFHRQPSVLIFEDLDAITSMPLKPGQEDNLEAIYSERMALLFISLIQKLMKTEISFGNKVVIIATAKSNKSLQTMLVQTRGKHIFQQMIELSSPDLQQRIDIISQLISHKFNDSNCDSHININLKDIALKCKGYFPIDLSALIDRAVHNCFLTSQSISLNDLKLNEDNFRAAFDGFSPINLRGFDLELKSTRKLSDVGGLTSVKKCLMETLLWPIKYPLLYNKLPLKPQSSVMLFGAPGVGKTLIIEAIANECGINFIGIKGPELLSKYVGASEQSVRDLFSRAQSAKPCILFFDEFDSLAPRRGHDSTGVTDRVVNQLLTQMDGFEALQTGVYVLSATSRPDLIDPALLRPGRFDKCLYCSLPNQYERYEILNALSIKLSFSSDVDLKMMSSLTHNFSGADLQALLYNAQLDALHNHINKNSNKLFNNQQIKCLEITNNKSLQFIAYMPTLEKGFSRNLSCDERQLLINEIESLKYNEIYLSNAQIDDNNSVDILSHKQTSAHNLIPIEQKHLLDSLQNTKPSINENERKRYDKIYEAFRANRGQSFQLSSQMTQKKVTLA